MGKFNTPPEAPHFMKDIPSMAQDYIDKIWDVQANGHCGFRTVAFALEHGQDAFMEVQKELYENVLAQSDFSLTQGFFHHLDTTARQIRVEHDGPCDIDHWMSMPTTGHILVEVYDRPVFYFSHAWSQSFFHSSSGPNKNPPIFMALTVSRHFVALKMMDETLFPAPQYEKNWEQLATPEALKWRDKYARSFELTNQLKLETGFRGITF